VTVTESVDISEAALNSTEVNQILRYWLLALRYEEAIAARPTARRQRLRPKSKIDIQNPSGYQSYSKLSIESAPFLLKEDKQLKLPLDAERGALFERWLKGQYWQQISPYKAEESRVWFVGLPTLYDPRSGELATLLRFPVQISWYSGAKSWKIPKQYKRQGSALPEPPDSLRLSLGEEEEDLLPYILDLQLLGQRLGVSDEELDDLQQLLQEAAEISPARMAATLCQLLERPLGEENGSPTLATEPKESPEALFRRLLEASRRRLMGGRHAVYPVGLLYDGSQMQATWHLQRELMALLKRPPWEGRRWHPLWGYLSGRAPAPGWAPLYGVFAPHGLTPDQRGVAEQFLGSRLTAAQGPPGTGKTALIQALAAGQLVERCAALMKGRLMPTDLLVISSTNNRAVDNVLEPMAQLEPALGLRGGSQAITRSRSVELLSQTQSWLISQAKEGAAEEYKEALAHFSQLYKKVSAKMEGRVKSQRRRSSLKALEHRLTLLKKQGGEGKPESDPGALHKAVESLRMLSHRLSGLEQRLIRRSRDSLLLLRHHWRSTQSRQLKRLRPALKDLGLELELGLPPKISKRQPLSRQFIAWEEGVEEAEERVDDLRFSLERRLQKHRLYTERLEVETEIAGLKSADEEMLPMEPEEEAQHFKLFQAALRLRTAWCVLHHAALLPALERALEMCSERRSLKRFADEDADGIDWLLRLYPVWGSTLLSLGNVFSLDADFIKRLVIDEAGQCHPAFAVSGLARGTHALLIGDVHQLEPVIRLSEPDEERVRRLAEIKLSEERLKPYQPIMNGGRSAQSLADRAVLERPTLHDHFRSQPEIIGLSDAFCRYGLRICTPPHSLKAQSRLLFEPLLMARVFGPQQRLRGSWRNDSELDALISLLSALGRDGIPWSEIAVITPYVGQLESLHQRLRRLKIPWFEENFEAPPEPQPGLFSAGTLATGTVHRFQGGERSIVLFSTVVSRPRSLGFLNGRVNLVNVAVSRARDHLIIVGNPEVLKLGKYTALLVDRSKDL